MSGTNIAPYTRLPHISSEISGLRKAMATVNNIFCTNGDDLKRKKWLEQLQYMT